MRKLLFVLTGLMATLTFFARQPVFVMPTLVLSSGTLLWFTRTDLYQAILGKIQKNHWTLNVFTLGMAALVAWSMSWRTAYNAFKIQDARLHFLLSLGTTYFLFHYLTWFYGIFLAPILKRIKWKWLLATIPLLLAIILLNHHTTVFFAPSQTSLDHGYDGFFFLDVLFQTDTDALFRHYNVFLADVPDSRQPLFSLFSFPITAPLYLFGPLYPALMMWLQFLLAFLSGYLLYDLAKGQLQYPKLFLAFFLSSYSLLIFPLILERFVFGLFYVVLFIYLGREQGKTAFLGAVGTNLLSAGLGIFLLGKGQVKEILKLMGAFLGLMSVFGRLPLLFYTGSVENSARWITFEVGFINQLQQFSEFLYGSIVFPATMIDYRDFPRYEQAIVTSFNWIGVLILGLTVLSAIKYFDRYLVKVSAYWLLIAFLLFGILGWSTSQHNLILFSVFFSFSFIYLVYIALEKVLPKWVMGFGILGLLIYNLFGLVDLLRFAITYYPV